eukprot:TRINITY_DN9642_c0_g1_i1.p1 TRINITY_DN9642_c0_g1~~TRINITY_DN9642_c0_g1_i1.p1  ORF type:complete len:181 (-),score=35.63 TRINITY_DN9642_c0_g1_i1:107-649(-)
MTRVANVTRSFVQVLLITFLVVLLAGFSTRTSALVTIESTTTSSTEDMSSAIRAAQQAKNVLGNPLKPCSLQPLTGYFRDGCCNTNDRDFGSHTVCALITQEFLDFTKARGNDLTTKTSWFPGLKAGDRWCLCASRWKEAADEGVFAPVFIDSTHENALKVVPLDQLLQHRTTDSHVESS